MESNFRESIRLQRAVLNDLLEAEMSQLAQQCALLMGDRMALERLLGENLDRISYCKHLYALDKQGVQLTHNCTRGDNDDSYFGRDRMGRPYMQGIVGFTDFRLSEAYISRNQRRPSVTAIQVIRDHEGALVGFLGADYDLRELPHTEALYKEPDGWRQLKGDPAIRGGLFLQQRAESQMDTHLDEVLPLMAELMREHGVFHGKLHFSSSRATIWLSDDPFTYRLLAIDALIDPDLCLAYPRRSYHERAIVPPEQILAVFEMFRTLRFADTNVYLRAGSLNVINGMVGLNFSCDGSHYMRFDEFLGRSISFWFGIPGGDSVCGTAGE